MTGLPAWPKPSDTAAPGTFQAIFRALDACSEPLVGPAAPRLLVIPIHDGAGRVAGGLWGHTQFGWLHVEMLLVPEAARGRGVGSALMAAAEIEARHRGCLGVLLDGFSFQATPFYEKLGFSLFGVLDDFPPGHRRLYFHKRLDLPRPSGPDPGAHHACHQALQRARGHVVLAQDEAAKQAYVDVLQLDPTHLPALRELGALAIASGHRSAARSAFVQAVEHHPDDPTGRVALGNLLAEDGDLRTACLHYQAALDVAPGFAEAHQGLARALTELGDPAADEHWHPGFDGNALETRRYRGIGPGVPLLLLVSARGGNIPIRQWIDDRSFAVTAIYADFHDPAQPLPPHALVVNAIGDADLCGLALRRAEAIVAHSTAPVINPPARVLATGRVENARRLGGVPGVMVADVKAFSHSALLATRGLTFPLLLRAPGFHTGRHFVRVESPDVLADAVATLPGDEVLAIGYLDARGPDSMARKYRVMFIDGVCYPLHLAISGDWKVHYFTAAMAQNPLHREEESRFLDDMPQVLGEPAIAAVAAIRVMLGLDYGGIDFALSPDGSVLLFEANATMVIVPPDADPMWDYRRRAIAAAQQAARQMLLRRARPWSDTHPRSPSPDARSPRSG